MKIKCCTCLLALALAQPVLAAEENAEGACATDHIKRAPNVLLEIITIPFKAVVALTHGPRCLIDSIPKNS